MGKKENAIAFPVRDYGESQGFEVRKVSYEGREGCPDWMYYGYGEIFFIEFKTPVGTLRPNQRREIAKMRKNAVRVFVVDDIDVGKLIVDGAKKTGAKNAG